MSRVTVKVLRLPHAQGLELPSITSAMAAGCDLTAAVDDPVEIAAGARAVIPTGFAFAIPPGYEGQVRARSGLAAKHGVTVLNAPGTIDADYRGEVKAILINHSQTAFTVTRGLRMAQMVIAPVIAVDMVEADSLDETTRGTGGFGSSGMTQ